MQFKKPFFVKYFRLAIFPIASFTGNLRKLNPDGGVKKDLLNNSMFTLYRILLIGFFLQGGLLFSQDLPFSDQLVKKTVIYHNKTTKSSFVDNSALHTEHWDTLPQPKFWMDILSLSPDSCILNVASCRKPLQKICLDEWSCQEEAEKNEYKSYLCSANQLDPGTTLFVTTGKKEFYEHKKVVPMLDRAIRVFMENNTDPWYAQTILLIESPGKSTQVSSVGAYGPFQLMRSVARRFGLTVTKSRDDRADLEKSAKAAAALLRTMCLPNVRAMLDLRDIPYKETDLWFRLLVLHAYHAGSGNLAGVVNKINPKEGGISLITTLWQTEWGGFKNESQNYSQIALASLLLFDRIINQDGDTVFMVQGDRIFAHYKNAQYQHQDAATVLSNCIRSYENDLVDGTLPFEDFVRKVNAVQKEMQLVSRVKKPHGNYVSMNQYPFDDTQLNHIGNQLMRKKNIDDAIKVFKLSVENYPNSISAYDSLGRAYKMLGKPELALKYKDKYNKLSKGEKLSP